MFLKKCISILLAFLIFLNTAGYIILFWEIQQDIKNEMIQKISRILPSEELTCIKFLKKNISRSDWLEKNELEYQGDRKSTRLNSSHLGISYAVFCLKK